MTYDSVPGHSFLLGSQEALLTLLTRICSLDSTDLPSPGLHNDLQSTGTNEVTL